MTLLATHETKFGDTCLTYASSLGRHSIVNLLLDECKSIVEKYSVEIALSDLVNRESSRGKVAIIEATKNALIHVASALLSNSANVNLVPKTTRKTALDWATTLKDEAMLELMNEHTQLSQRITSLFKAISNGDKDTVVSLVEGGVPYVPFASPLKDLETIRSQLDGDKKQNCELQQLLSTEEPKLAAAIADREERINTIAELRSTRQKLVSNRRIDFVEAMAVLRLAATDDNLEALRNIRQAPLEYELIAKGLCTLFHIKVNEDEDESSSNTPFFRQLQVMMKDKSKFLHRLKHYQLGTLVPSEVSSLVQVINGLDKSEICLGAFMASLAKYVSTLLQQIPTHEQEHDLLIEQRAEDDALQRISTDIDVLKSRCTILRRELGDTVDSISKHEQLIKKLQREIEVSTILSSKAFSGHTVLSWVAANGTSDIVKVLLKHGAHTAIDERIIHSCATIIQILWRRRKHDTQDKVEERERSRCMCLRIRSLSRSVRSHLKSVRLPLAEALYNGNADVVSLLDRSDISLFHAINLLHLFRSPCTTFPRPLSESNIEDGLLSSIVHAGDLYHIGDDESDCRYKASLELASTTQDAYMLNRKLALERKMQSRRNSLFQNHRKELMSAIKGHDIDAMIKASEAGCIHLDFEDPTTGMTPLICATNIDSTAQKRYRRRPGGREMSAVAYLLGRVSRLSPTVDYENSLGHTALTMACALGNTETIRELVVDGGADVNRPSCLDGTTPMMQVATAGKNKEEVMALLQSLGASNSNLE